MAINGENIFADYLADPMAVAWKTVGGFPGALSLGANLHQAGQYTKEALARGESRLGAVAGAFLRTAVYEIFPALMWAQAAANFVPAFMEGLYARYERKQAWWESLGSPNMGVFMDTGGALTMRQAGAQAIQASRLNARSVLGQEARLFAES